MFYPKNSWKDYGNIPGVYTAGELALVSSPLFREHRLRLYRQHISLILNRFICVSYLIVKDRTPVLRFRTDCDRNHIFFGHSKPGQLPICPIYDRDMEAGRVGKVLARLEPLLQEPGAPDWPDCTYIQVSPIVHSTMADLRMIREQTDGIWLPSDYGDSLGLIDGYMITDQGKSFHTFFLPAERRKELYQALTWSRACRMEKLQPVMPLEQRLEKIRQGLPSRNASAIEPIRAFGAMRLEDYMASYPEFPEELRQQFGDLATFQETADRIYQFCMGPNDHTACMEYISTLILPLFSIHDETAPLNQATKPAQDLLRLPFPTVLMGAAMAAGQPCLLRNTRLLLDKFLEKKEDKLQTTCWEMIRNLPRDDPEASLALLFRLLIEPFALMNQAVHTSCR